MNYKFGKCRKINLEKNKLIVLKDEDSSGQYRCKSKFKIRNNNSIKILIIKVDNCLEVNGKRCDWLFIILEENYAFFIELKGRNRDDGIKQLSNSIHQIQDLNNGFIKNKFDKITSYLVTNNTPRNNPKTALLRKKFKKENYNSDLIFISPKNSIRKVS